MTTIGFSRLSAGRRRITVLAVAAPLALLSLVAVPVSASASPGAACASTSGQSRVGRLGGIVHPLATNAACAARAEAPYGGNPPLIFHGGPVMAVPSVNSTVVHTAIYWAPPGYTFPARYKTIINRYLSGIAADSGSNTNVFSTNTQYTGSNGSMTYHVVAGTPISVSKVFPASGCTVNTGPVYSDGSGYTACLTDAQLTAEINTVLTARHLTSDLGHMYSIFTPKGVESCFDAGGTQCTINPTPSSAFCAYHSYFGSTSAPTVYANMPFPIFKSATGYSCTNEQLGNGIQAPNGNRNADVEVSPLSHEMSEAFTDPKLNAWYDASGNENGDDCAYIYGALSGAAGAHYNQVINGKQYLTQEEFSNAAFIPSVSGCLQHA